VRFLGIPTLGLMSLGRLLKRRKPRPPEQWSRQAASGGDRPACLWSDRLHPGDEREWM